MKFDRETFKLLLHYVIWRVGNKDGFGATKLYKVLWFAEARAYVTRGKPISGASFVKKPFGPMPREAKAVLDELTEEGAIRKWKDKYYNKIGTRFESLRRPVVNFDAEDLKDINYWADHIANDHTASSISEESHDYGWEIAQPNEVLPYHAILAERFRDPTDEELERAKRRAKDLKTA